MMILPTIPNAVKLAAMHSISLRNPYWPKRVVLVRALRMLGQ